MSEGARLATAALAALFALGLAVGVNALAERRLGQLRLDLTEARLYTLSEGTRAVLAGIGDPITLRLFASRRLGAELPAYGTHAQRIRALLREYVAASGGKLRLEVFDPEPFSEEEDRALALGLQGVPLDQAGEQVFLGLAAANLADEERAIPFFALERERFLEADLTRVLFELSSPAKPALGLMTALPVLGDPRAMMLRRPELAQPLVALRQLREAFAIEELAPDATLIPEAVQLLLLIHPQDLSAATQYALDQFVMRGGRLLLLLDPLSEFQAQRGGGRGATASALDRLLHAWGVDAPAGRAVLDLQGAWRVRAAPGERTPGVDYPAWFNLQGEGLNRAERATAQLDQVTVASAGSLRPLAGAAIDFVPLLTSSAQSMEVEVAGLAGGPSSRLLAGFRADGERRVIAARIRGTLPSAFPEGPPEGAAAGAHRARSAGPANLVVIHDTDLLDDRFWVRAQSFFGQEVLAPFSGNGALLVNLAETLSGSDALIGLRSRGESVRPFLVVEEIRRRAEAGFRQTEQALSERLQASEQRLRELRLGPGGAVITPEQRAEIDRARAEIAATRQQLRAVQRDARREIEALEARLRALNTAAVPILVVLAATGGAWWRARRRRAARAC